MATGGSSGSGSGSSGSGSSAISANLIFDSDLLVNARLLEKLDMETDASKAVIDWWYGVIDDAVYDEGDEYYDWVDYINSVETQKAKEGRILPFTEYKSEGEINPNNPATAKEVLEDGLLGEIQQNGNFSRLTAPELTVPAECGRQCNYTCMRRSRLHRKSQCSNGKWQFSCSGLL